eukprot:SAG11_NODE_33277_length_278_cov_0.675978_1_plen_50_part_10
MGVSMYLLLRSARFLNVWPATYQATEMMKIRRPIKVSCFKRESPNCELAA